MKKIEITNNSGQICCVIDGVLIPNLTAYNISSCYGEVPELTMTFPVPDCCQFETSIGTGKTPWDQLKERTPQERVCNLW